MVVGRDARKHSEMLYYAVISGLLSAGCSVTELGVTALCLAVGLQAVESMGSYDYCQPQPLLSGMV